jgi:YVTN family beta-propeller protein
MHSNKSNGSCSLLARGFAALWAMLAMGLALVAPPAKAGPFAYVVGSNVSVIDTATNEVVATVPVGGNAVAVTPDGTRAYVSDGSVIDTVTNRVVAKAPVVNFPNGVAVTPDGTRAYYTVGNCCFPDTTAVRVIDTAANRVAATIPLGGAVPNGIAITPDGKSAYVVSSRFFDFYVGVIVVIDTATKRVVSTRVFERDVLLFGLAIAPDGKAGYATADPGVEGLPSKVLSFGITPSGIPNGEFRRIDVGCFCSPRGIAVTPDGKHVYVARSDSNDVAVIDPASATVEATVPVGFRPLGVAITPDGKRAYVTNFDSNDVSVIECQQHGGGHGRGGR